MAFCDYISNKMDAIQEDYEEQRSSKQKENLIPQQEYKFLQKSMDSKLKSKNPTLSNQNSIIYQKSNNGVIKVKSAQLKESVSLYIEQKQKQLFGKYSNNFSSKINSLGIQKRQLVKTKAQSLQNKIKMIQKTYQIKVWSEDVVKSCQSNKYDTPFVYKENEEKIKLVRQKESFSCYSLNQEKDSQNKLKKQILNVKGKVLNRKEVLEKIQNYKKIQQQVSQVKREKQIKKEILVRQVIVRIICFLLLLIAIIFVDKALIAIFI